MTNREFVNDRIYRRKLWKKLQHRKDDSAVKAAKLAARQIFPSAIIPPPKIYRFQCISCWSIIEHVQAVRCKACGGGYIHRIVP